MIVDRTEEAGPAAEVGEAFDPGQEFAHGAAMEEEAAGDEDGMGNGGAAVGADGDIAGAAGDVGLAHFDHGGGVEDFRQRGLADVADRRAAEIVALAAGVDIAVVLDVHGAAPEVMAGVLPVLRGVGGIGAHEVCFVGLDAHFIDPGDGAPEAGELFDFVPVALHAHHLDDDLHFRAALLFAAGEVDEVVPHLFEFGAFAVELEALFGGAIEAEGDVFEVGIEEALGGGFIEERAVGGEEGEDFVLIAEGDAVEDFGIEERLAETD